MDNKTNILNTALELFASQGYESVGIQKIVDEAGITKPTMYHYFGSKKGLLEAILQTYYLPFIEKVGRAAKYTELQDNLTKITKVFFDFIRENKTFYRMQLAMVFSSPGSESYNSVKDYNGKLYLILEKLFTEASDYHGNMKGRHKRYAFTFLGMINNYATLFLGGHADLTDEDVYNAVHQFSHGIYS